MTGEAERDQVPLVVTAALRTGDKVMMLQVIGRPAGSAKRKLQEPDPPSLWHSAKAPRGYGELVGVVKWPLPARKISTRPT
jgi:hypothetical protein